MALKPIADAVGLERVIVSSYQSVSGTGQAAVRELHRAERPGYLAGDEPEPSVYPHPIAFNVLPHIDVFDESGYTGEERKVAAETRKMLGLPDLAVSATCVRVPVMQSHSQAVHIETTEAIDPDAVRRLLMARARRRAGGRARAQPLPAAARRDRPRRGAGRAASARTPRTRAASPCGW